MLVVAGIILSIAEFIVIGILVGKGTIVGYQNGLLAGGATVVASVVLVWLATFFLKLESPEPPVPEAIEPAQQNPQ